LESIAEVLEAAVRLAPAGPRGLSAPRALQSWPGIVHGGAVVALLDAAASRLGIVSGPRFLEGRLTSSLPLEKELGLESEPWLQGVTLTVRHRGQVVSSGTIGPESPAGPVIGEHESLARDGAQATSLWRGGTDGDPLPMSDDCLACGGRNPLGLGIGLRFDDDGVWTRFTPSARWRAPRAGVHRAVVPVVLDEVAWWLGALVAKEGGVTNRITVAMNATDLPPGEPLVAAGRFDDVTPIDKRRTFWRTRCALSTAAGTPLATASIVFRGGPEYSSRQLAYFRNRTPAAVFRRMFPAHAD